MNLFSTARRVLSWALFVPMLTTFTTISHLQHIFLLVSSHCVASVPRDNNVSRDSKKFLSIRLVCPFWSLSVQASEMIVATVDILKGGSNFEVGVMCGGYCGGVSFWCLRKRWFSEAGTSA